MINLLLIVLMIVGVVSVWASALDSVEESPVASEFLFWLGLCSISGSCILLTLMELLLRGCV